MNKRTKDIRKACRIIKLLMLFIILFFNTKAFAVNNTATFTPQAEVVAGDYNAEQQDYIDSFEFDFNAWHKSCCFGKYENNNPYANPTPYCVEMDELDLLTEKYCK